MQEKIRRRAIKVGEVYISKDTTVRELAKEFGVSKSTVHKDLARLEKIKPSLHNEVKVVANKNFTEKSIRGGLATKLLHERGRKYGAR